LPLPAAGPGLAAARHCGSHRSAQGSGQEPLVVREVTGVKRQDILERQVGVQHANEALEESSDGGGDRTVFDQPLGGFDRPGHVQLQDTGACESGASLFRPLVRRNQAQRPVAVDPVEIIRRAPDGLVFERCGQHQQRREHLGKHLVLRLRNDTPWLCRTPVVEEPLNALALGVAGRLGRQHTAQGVRVGGSDVHSCVPLIACTKVNVSTANVRARIQTVTPIRSPMRHAL
jgi:hypothetical protein